MRLKGTSYFNHTRYHFIFLILKTIQERNTANTTEISIISQIEYKRVLKMMLELQQIGLVRQIHPYLARQVRPEKKCRYFKWYMVTDLGREYLQNFEKIKEIADKEIENKNEIDLWDLPQSIIDLKNKK